MPETTPPPTDRSEEGLRRKFITERSAKLSGWLREAADRIDRHAADFGRIDQRGYQTAYGQITGQMIHEITTMLMNAPIDGLVQDAAEADACRVLRLASDDPSA